MGGLTRELGLIMNEYKRGVGTHLVWLGFNILATPGMLCITKKKVVKLTLQIAAAIKGSLLLADYRSMMGSLEHILFATSRDRAQMLGLWRPLRGEWSRTIKYDWMTRRKSSCVGGWVSSQE